MGALRDVIERRLDGPLPAWPAAVDRTAEWWAGRRPRVRVTVAAAAAGLVVVATVALGSGSGYGAAIPVLVAGRDLAAGRTLAAGDLVPTTLPAAAVPASALPPTEPWVGRVTTGPLPRGGVMTGLQLAEAGIAALVAGGRVAVAVPAELLPAVPVGRRVDLLAGGSESAVAAARDGRIVAVDDAHVWIEVDRDDAPAVAAAVAWGRVTLAVLSER